jgi:hypothetical protein
MAEHKVLVELTEQELKQLIGTVVKQMVRVSTESLPNNEEIITLSSVIKKCTKALK